MQLLILPISYSAFIRYERDFVRQKTKSFDYLMFTCLINPPLCERGNDFRYIFQAWNDCVCCVLFELDPVVERFQHAFCLAFLFCISSTIFAVVGKFNCNCDMTFNSPKNFTWWRGFCRSLHYCVVQIYKWDWIRSSMPTCFWEFSFIFLVSRIPHMRYHELLNNSIQSIIATRTRSCDFSVRVSTKCLEICSTRWCLIWNNVPWRICVISNLSPG